MATSRLIFYDIFYINSCDLICTRPNSNIINENFPQRTRTKEGGVSALIPYDCWQRCNTFLAMTASRIGVGGGNCNCRLRQQWKLYILSSQLKTYNLSLVQLVAMYLAWQSSFQQRRTILFALPHARTQLPFPRSTVGPLLLAPPSPLKDRFSFEHQINTAYC